MKNSNYKLCYVLIVLSIPISFVLSSLVFWVSTIINFNCQSFDLPILTHNELGIPITICINCAALIHAIEVGSNSKKM